MSWAPITWIFFHSFSHKVNEEYYEKNSKLCNYIIKYVCQHLPCPTCYRHANQYLSKYNIDQCKTKQQLIDYLWIFHNRTNIRLNKPIFTKEDLEKYNRCNFDRVCLVFFQKFSQKYYYGAAMDSWLRKNVTGNLKRYFWYNWKFYN